MQTRRVEHTQQHMSDLIEHLVRAGNSVRYHPSSATDPFWHQQGGPQCFLTRPIDFAVVEAVPGRPADLVLAPDNDLIFCRLCWTAITGPGYRPETVWDRRR